MGKGIIHDLKGTLPVMLIYVIGPMAAVSIVYSLTDSAWLAILSYVTWIILFVIYRIYVLRDFYMTQLRFIEVTLFGKTLDKENWKRGELLRTRPWRWKQDVATEGDTESSK
jgi:hypothetical protein